MSKREDIKKQIAEKIIRRMESRGIYRFLFSQIMHVQPSVVTKWLSGTHNFSIETLIEIQEKLGVRLIDVDASEVHAGTPCFPCTYFNQQNT